MNALRAFTHIGVGRARRKIPLIVFPGRMQRGQRFSESARRRTRAGYRPRRTAERSAQQCRGAKNLRMQQCTPRSDGRAEIMPDDRGDAAESQRLHQAQGILHQVKQMK